MGAKGTQRAHGSRQFRPRRNLWSAAWVAWMAFTTPAFAVVYMLTVPLGRWPPFAIAHVVLIVAFALAAGRLRGAGVLLASDGIREREYFSRTVFTPIDRIDGVLILRVRDSYTDEVSSQIFVTDAAGRTLLRLRSPLWHPADLKHMVDFYDVPVQTVSVEMTWRQLRHEYGRNLEAWERHPVLTAVGSAVVLGALAVGAVVAIMAAVS